MPRLPTDVIHGESTRRSGYQYRFTSKHHGASPSDAQWLPSLTLDEEFSVFDMADAHDLRDSGGRLYGILRTPANGVQFIGTRDEQVAEFPVPGAGEPWHGFPVYPLASSQMVRRGGEAGRPEKIVFDQMERVGLLSKSERRRLMKGKHI